MFSELVTITCDVIKVQHPQLFGISLGVIAVYIFEESQNYILFIGEKNLTGLKLLMGAGGTLVVLGALGLLTTVRLNRKLMLFVSN